MNMIIKRIFDFIGSIILLIILPPFFIIVAILIKLDSKGPVFFKQNRIGKNEQLFKIVKFRTMVDDAENIGPGIYTSEIDPRITRIGKVLRKLSIDEIPQIINILKGDMSFIGPRPAPIHHLNQYSEKEKLRLRMKPGITGWSQVNGRNKITWPERIEKDIWYIENYSLWLDIKIFFKTIKVILTSEGIYSGRYDDKFKEWRM